MAIFFGRIADVSLGTIRINFIIRHKKIFAALVGFIEVTIFIFVAARVIQDLNNNIYGIFAYGAGFAAGTIIGMTISDKLSRDLISINIISKNSGEGGDEMFLGYDRLKAAKLNKYYNILPSALRRKVLSPLILKLPDQPQKKGAINMLKRFVEGTLYPEEAGAMRWQYFLNPVIEKNIFNSSSRENISFNPFEPIYYFANNCNSPLRTDKDIYVDIKLTMADSVLMKVDKMSMATSLEVRVPFLDHEIAELCASIPASLKMQKTTTKYILRKTLKKYDFLPENIIYRGKQGYSIPVKNWLRQELKGYMQDLFKSSPVIKENFNGEYIDLLIEEHSSMKHNHNHILWALINLGLWYKKFFVS